MLKMLDLGKASKLTKGVMLTGLLVEASIPPYNRYNCTSPTGCPCNHPWC